MTSILADTSSGGFWMPPRASTVAGQVDGLFSFIFWITVFFFVLVLILMLAFVIKYRHREGREQPERAPAHSTALELTWTVIPTVLVLMIFYFGFRGYMDMSVAPPNSYEIQVQATSWSWAFVYPNGHVATELHVPVNMPVRLVLTSNDVIHSFYVPQFRIKKDVVPGRYNRTWFQATQTGTFDLYCAEYCGQGHSRMFANVVVEEPAEFAKWLERESNWETRMSPREAGEKFVSGSGCLQCHSIDGSRMNGPTFKDLFGKQETLVDGSTVLVDEDYIRESIFDPGAKVVQGYGVQMASYRGRFKDRDVAAIIEYLKSISVHYKTIEPASAPATPPTQ